VSETSKRTPEELREASDHLYYEIGMLQSMAGVLASGALGESQLKNAALESFALHARVLLEFCYSDKPHPVHPDVIAANFFEDASSWINERPPKTELLAGIHDRVGKQVAHLSYKRQDVTPEDKKWSFAQIATDLQVVLDTFYYLVPRNVLGKRWQKVIELRDVGT